MRLFAQEKFSGTYEMLMTTPVQRFSSRGRQVHRRYFLHADVGLPLLGCLLILQRYTTGQGR